MNSSATSNPQLPYVLVQSGAGKDGMTHWVPRANFPAPEDLALTFTTYCEETLQVDKCVTGKDIQPNGHLCNACLVRVGADIPADVAWMG